MGRHSEAALRHELFGAKVQLGIISNDLRAANAHRDLAREQAQTALEELIDSEAQVRRLNEQLNFLGWYELESWDAAPTPCDHVSLPCFECGTYPEREG